jgi:hypothetical protein
MQRSTIQEMQRGHYLMATPSQSAGTEIRHTIEKLLGQPSKTVSGSIALGEICESYESEQGHIELSFDAGFGYEIWCDQERLNEELLRQLGGSAHFALERAAAQVPAAYQPAAHHKARRA